MKTISPRSFGFAVLRLLAAVVFVAVAPPPSTQGAAGDWNYAYGQGNVSDDWLISGCSIPLAVVTSVHSNAQYYITSAKASGAPRLDQIWFKTDTLGSTIRFYTATNVWTCASNQPAGTNIIWLTETNSAMATNDILVYRDVAADSYQMMIVSGNATDAFGTVFTNASGYVGIKVFNTPTNTIKADDKLYKMALQQSLNPLGMGIITNQINAVVGDHFGQWLALGTRTGPLFSFRANSGLPSMVVMTTSNASGGMFQAVGDYFVRQRR